MLSLLTMLYAKYFTCRVSHITNLTPHAFTILVKVFVWSTRRRETPNLCFFDRMTSTIGKTSWVDNTAIFSYTTNRIKKICPFYPLFYTPQLNVLLSQWLFPSGTKGQLAQNLCCNQKLFVLSTWPTTLLRFLTTIHLSEATIAREARLSHCFYQRSIQRVSQGRITQLPR